MQAPQIFWGRIIASGLLQIWHIGSEIGRIFWKQEIHKPGASIRVSQIPHNGGSITSTLFVRTRFRRDRLTWAASDLNLYDEMTCLSDMKQTIDATS